MRRKQRVQVTQQLAEQDLVRNGSDVWTWDSKQREATHVTLPKDTATSLENGTTTPADIAKQAIDAITPSTTVSKPTSTTVAGQRAWQVVLTPKSSDTLVGRVELAVDQQTGLPLRAAVLAKGQSDPAFQVGYTSLSYGAPASRLFDFTPPSDAKVTTKDLSDAEHHAGARGHAGDRGDAPTTTGTGWATIAELPAGSADTGSLDADGSALLGQVTKAVDGGRALQTSLVSVYLTDDGRVLAGAVPVSSLVAAAK